MLPKRPSPSSVCLPPDILERLQTSAERLSLSVNAAVLTACHQLEPVLKAGWRPRCLLAAQTGTLLLLRIEPKIKTHFRKSAEAAGLTFSDFVRLAAVAALIAMEGKDRVLWPLEFSEADFRKTAPFIKAAE